MRSPTAFEAPPGWFAADHAGAWRAFRRSARHIAEGAAELRRSRPASPAMRRLCEQAAAMPNVLDHAAARHFFEASFRPRVVSSAEGLLTGYYEPVVEGTLACAPGFAAPIIDRPDDWPDGATVPDRAALEQFAVTAAARPVVWLRDWTEVFLVHVQGSTRVRLPDGKQRRLVYAGRNGLPYTSIGKRLIETGRIAPAAMSLEALKAWLRRHGQEPGDPGRALMHENRSFIFFRLEPMPAAEAGPVGGQGILLAGGISAAVDRTLWSYGLPFFFAAEEPLPGFAPVPFAGLFVAQDTGSAIVGPARADLFVGSGPAAGTAAGRIRHPARVTVLEPLDP